MTITENKTIKRFLAGQWHHQICAWWNAEDLEERQKSLLHSLIPSFIFFMQQYLLNTYNLLSAKWSQSLNSGNEDRW